MKYKILIILMILILPCKIKAMSVEETIEAATVCMEKIAGDAAYGYNSQPGHRWGEEGDFACSTLNEYCWDQVGVKVIGNKNTDQSDSRMINRYLKAGFVNVVNNQEIDLKTGAGLERGDVLICSGNHTAQYVGNGQLVEAAMNEKGGSGPSGWYGQPGDQNDNEIHVRSYYKFTSDKECWDYVLRYKGTQDENGGGSIVDYPKNDDGTDKEFKKFLKGLFTIIEISAPIIASVLTVIDYLKALGNPELMKKTNKRMGMRLVITIAIVFVPFLLNWLFEIFGLYDLRNCVLVNNLWLDIFNVK